MRECIVYPGCQPVEGHVLHAGEVDQGGRNHQHVEDLVAVEPESEQCTLNTTK